MPSASGGDGTGSAWKTSAALTSLRGDQRRDCPNFAPPDEPLEVRLVCVSDLHGYLPPVEPCDLLLVAGDICPTGDERPKTQREWLHSTFADWLAEVPADIVVGVAGNHDFVGRDRSGRPARPGLALPAGRDRRDRWHVVLRLPVDLALPGLGLHAQRGGVGQRWAQIPAGVDVLCVHSPPLGYGDWISGQHIGSPSLLAAIDTVRRGCASSGTSIRAMGAGSGGPPRS